MKRIILVALAFSMMTASLAFGADDVLTKATKLLEKRHYEEVIVMLRSNAASIDPAKQGTANLTLGMAYLKNAQLHRELYQAAASVSQDYLKKLSAAQGQGRSRFVDFYLGDALMESGKPGVAVIYLEKFSNSAGIDARSRSIARVCLGLCYYGNNEAQKAQELWGSIDAADPEVRAELASAYSKARIADKDPVALADGSFAEMKRSNKPLSMRAIKNIAGVYARAGLTEKGLDLLRHSDLKGYSFRESLSKTKIITFYDLSLLGDIATLYGKAGILYLEKASADPKAKDAANYYLGQAYALFGSAEQSARVTAAFLATSQMPPSYKDRIRVWQSATLYQKTNMTDAASAWDELSRKQPDDPDLLAEILFACNRLKVECGQITKRSAAMAEAGEGKKFGVLNIAIGKYYLGKMDYSRAITYLEAGRDKSNKNKIESNDPAMLVNLADAYFRTKKYSEALEIYFEMSKQFPQVRQIQESMQGIYAMDHKSAGDVKIN